MTRLMIIDKNPLELVGLKLLFNNKKVEIQSETSSSLEKLDERIEEWQPRVILLDFNSCESFIDDLTFKIKKKHQDIKVLWMLLDDSDVIQYDAISALADGCVLKAELNQISKAVAVVQEEEVFYSRQLLAKFAFEASMAIDHLGRKVSRLTDREKDVLQLIRRGFTNEEISRQLYISVETVKAHVRSIRSTLGVDNRRQMIIGLRSLKKDNGENENSHLTTAGEESSSLP